MEQADIKYYLVEMIEENMEESRKLRQKLFSLEVELKVLQELNQWVNDKKE